MSISFDKLTEAAIKSKAFGTLDSADIGVLRMQLVSDDPCPCILTLSLACCSCQDENEDGSVSLYEFAKFVGTSRLRAALDTATGIDKNASEGSGGK
jgi:hypothetical protein